MTRHTRPCPPSSRPVLRALLLPLVALLVAGCGVPVEDTPRVIEVGTPSRMATGAPSAAASGPAAESLYLIRDGSLVAVQRRLPTEPDPQHLLGDLLAGPTEAEQDRGLGTALGGRGVVASVQLLDGIAHVELPAGIEGTGRNDDVLAFGQIVCTLTSRADVMGVVFTRQGVRIGVPLPDASLSQEPLRAADYATLIATG
ncbi:GerMN domain-containing protein [Catellatospora sichuanensis]|uniref:GerMN domain-containing protein n=1 Tax=Catellatospora sichuanensis TaxID=1969805 RepID=UPI001FE2A3CD|nr:GerMN domain-containing protein [Catellatospora sichuanensis]